MASSIACGSSEQRRSCENAKCVFIFLSAAIQLHRAPYVEQLDSSTTALELFFTFHLHKLVELALSTKLSIGCASFRHSWFKTETKFAIQTQLVM